MKFSKAFAGSIVFAKFINNNSWHVIKFNFTYNSQISFTIYLISNSNVLYIYP